jgi:hypothetical protein
MATIVEPWPTHTLDDLELTDAERQAAHMLRIGYSVDLPKYIEPHREGLDGLVARGLIERLERPGRLQYFIAGENFDLWDRTYNTLGWME